MILNYDKIELARANKCMSRKQLARRLKLSEASIARYMWKAKGGQGVYPETAGKIAKALGVKVEELI